MTEPLADALTIATRLGVENPTNAVLAAIEDQIADSTSKAAGILNRDTPLQGVERSLQQLQPVYGVAMTDPAAWPEASATFGGEAFTVKSYAVSPVDPYAFDVVFMVGLDLSDPAHPVRRYIAADARARLQADAIFCKMAKIKRVVTSVSAGGQSVSYEKQTGSNANGQAGSSLDETTIQRYRRHVVYVAPAPRLHRWPYI